MASKLAEKIREEIAKKTKKIYKVTYPNGTYEEFHTSKTARKYSEKNDAIKVELKNTKIEVTGKTKSDIKEVMPAEWKDVTHRYRH